MSLLMTFKPDQSLEQVTEQTGVQQGLADRLNNTDVQPHTQLEQPAANAEDPVQVADDFEPEFDGDLKNVSWLPLHLFEKTEDF